MRFKAAAMGYINIADLLTVAENQKKGSKIQDAFYQSGNTDPACQNATDNQFSSIPLHDDV
jgi:hypothetical protein